MINGVLHPSQLSPSIFTQTRSQPAAPTAPVAERSSTHSPAGAPETIAQEERNAMFRDYQMLGLATRQFAEILPQIESLDVPIE